MSSLSAGSAVPEAAGTAVPGCAATATSTDAARTLDPTLEEVPEGSATMPAEAAKSGSSLADSTDANKPERSRSKITAPASSTGRRFQRELRSMMFGFGDDRQPQAESVQLLEEMVVDYIRGLLQQAQQTCEHRVRGARKAGSEAKVRDRDLLFVLRKDRRRHERVIELLEVWKEVKAARGGAEDPKALDRLEYDSM
mmetsp:Transcript_35302/g.92648  ORF Transcript_35302/g.92648 Transcript_35302/m.92648 type:complete len:197 (-) Transcript_35302:381-971(-)|eukprot:CAMPEP_0115849448 /NCGR_PEP_ID=MMETSP0287-20121206/11455_1 /TAXON_ID=412157 /ORGANISM="Chrysochromulina rotalis, Strain UIO044" /LENGTH=196 /DNA_ID=CAMNT_0003303417 /DNA_START=37 /DNA_END=627 /DNA_ORIENTATION=+